MLQLVLASSNKKKLTEFRRISKEYNVEIISAHDISFTDDIPEDANSFAENALIKARAVHVFAPDKYVIADDSGLCVQALGGAPGIYSARYGSTKERLSDANRNTYLLDKLSALQRESRGASFHCSIALIFPDGTEFIFDGSLDGFILPFESGSNGFGYDPIFQPVDYDVSMAELSDEEKDRISHRGKALRNCLDYLCKADLITKGRV